MMNPVEILELFRHVANAQKWSVEFDSYDPDGYSRFKVEHISLSWRAVHSYFFGIGYNCEWVASGSDWSFNLLWVSPDDSQPERDHLIKDLVGDPEPDLLWLKLRV